jgi:hypothetical protein
VNNLKKVAIFVEGLSELILVQRLLLIIGESSVSYKTFELHCNDLRKPESDSLAMYDYKNPSANIEFLIIKANNDEKVVSAIKERAEGLIKQGYMNILGLRDMYSERYAKTSKGFINNQTTDDFIKGVNSIIQDMDCHDKIKIFFAIMEVEAWFLSTWEIFEKIDSSLTYSCIKTKLKFDSKLDPRIYYRPSREVKKILKDYDKSKGKVCKIVNKLEIEHINKVIEDNRCKEYEDFIDEIKILTA